MIPETCPNCGADVPPGAKACPECGADEQTGWSEDAATQSLNLPDQEFDYDEFVKREFRTEEKAKPRGVPWFWWAIAVGLLLGMIALLIFRS